MRKATAPATTTMVTRSWAWRATDRDLRMSARILSCACAATLKTKKPVAAGILKKRKKPATLSVAGPILKRKKPTRAATVGAEIRIPEGEGADKILLEPSELLKLKKKAFEAQELWGERDVPGALERWKAEEAKAAAAEEEEAQPEPKKRKRLVITRLPDKLINFMKEDSFLMEIPADELEKLDSMSYGFAETYHMRKFIDDKTYAYEQALTNQHNILGYADDVDEVTDDEQD